MRSLLLFVLILLSSLHTYCQNPTGQITNNVFKAGEEINYLVSYNWNFIWLDVGAARFNVRRDMKNGETLYQLIGQGSSFNSWNWFFKVNDVYQSWGDSVSLKPRYFSRDVSEGGFKINIDYEFDRNRNIAYSESEYSNKAYRRDTINITPDTYDIMSIVYYARCIDYDKYQPNDTIPITILLDTKLTNIYFRYLGKEEYTVKGVGTFKAIKISAYLVEGTIFEEGEDMVIWVSDDKNKIPVWVEAPIIVGAIKIRLKSCKGLKYDLTSLIKKAK